MAEDPGTSVSGINKSPGVYHYLELLENAPSDHSKNLIISEKLVPWIQSKGMPPKYVAQLSSLGSYLSGKWLS